MVLLLFSHAPAAEEKRLAVYTAQTNFTILVIDHDGQDYVSVTDLVDPIGDATLTHKGRRWKLRLDTQGKNTEAEFREAADTATVRGKTVHLTKPFWTDGQRGYVPVASTAVLMAQFTHQSTSFRENSRRLFVGDVSTTFTAEVSKSAPNKLVLHFSAPVNPEIATEPGRVRLRFNREPLIPGGSNPQSFDSAAIHSSTFSESNGGSEITVATSAPTQAAFSDGGRTVILTASLPAAQAAAPPANPGAPSATNTASAQPQQTPPAQSATTSAAQPAASPRFVVLIDPAHGGDDSGATLGDGLLEKDVTMAIARRIRADLDQRGIATILLRDGDSTLTLEQRAATANGSRAALYLGIHATTFGTGVHLYSARFNGDVRPANHGFLPWDSAQALYLNTSHNLAASLVTEFESRQIHSLPLESGLRPLRNVAKPAIVVEVAEPEHPPADVKEGLSSVAYQQAIAAAVGSGVANVRGAVEGHQ
jgi:N-acetylmuramoyl-L-alanine amidase